MEEYQDSYERVVIDGVLVAAIWFDLEDRDWNIEILAGEEKGECYSMLDSREEALQMARDVL